MANKSAIILFVAILISISGCNKKHAADEKPMADISLVNIAHLEALYEEIIIDQDSMGIIHIYSEYPDYHWVDDADEGIACVDDAARAAIFFLNHYQQTRKDTDLLKARRLLHFVLYMQARNGLFYNFIWGDHSINKTYKTSVAKPDWWTWRAMWALANGVHIFKDLDLEFSTRLISSLKKATTASLSHLPLSAKTKFIKGFKLPSWLPYTSAADQAALLLLSLTPYYQMTMDRLVINHIKSLANGIALMQAGDSTHFPYYAFLSWQNTWHGYGNSQSYALLRAGKLLDDAVIIESALNEIKYFYPYANDHHLTEFKVRKENQRIVVERRAEFPQIAYNIRPMVFACLEAYNVTGDKYYAIQAGKIACWLFGNNNNKARMYFPDTGICYDGITDSRSVNRNSGAESTIEALLILQMIEQNSIAKKIVMDYRLKHQNEESI